MYESAEKAADALFDAIRREHQDDVVWWIEFLELVLRRAEQHVLGGMFDPA